MMKGLLMFSVLLRLQWGRAPESAEIPGAVKFGPLARMLQWGRAPESAEIIRREYTRATAGRFNGAALRRARR